MDGPISLSEAPKRKNGRLQSCEPCRKRKVACDHRLPVCSRCRRGGVADKCVYMTQLGQRTHPHQSRHDSISRSSVVAAVPPLRPPQVANGSSTPKANMSENNNVGYLGATSITTFYEEAQNRLSTAWKREPDPETLPLKIVEAFPRLDEFALSALRAIPDMATSKLLARMYSSFYGGWCPLAGEWLTDSVWAAYGGILGQEPRDEEQLRRISVKLCKNSAVPLGDDRNKHVEEWFDEFSGPNLRWESLGILFVFWAYGARRLPDKSILPKDCIDLQNNHGSCLVSRYKTAAWKCIELSRDASNSNTLLAFVVFGHCLLESTVSGDAGMQYWRTHGDLMALTTYLGLHVSPNADPMDWSVTTQIKRRLFAAIFAHDKVTSTFTGRPMFLGRNFTSTPLPLDMSDELLLSNPSITRREDCRVDENGWNIDGKIYTTTTLRARGMLAYIRDEILEISLQGMDFGGKTALVNLKRREMQIVASFPSCLIYQAEDINNFEIPGRELYGKLLVWLEHLQNLFFIERLLSKEDGASEANETRLFEISIEMVTLAHLFWTHQNRLKTAQDCVEWNVVSYAAPAGGVLCMELLKGTTRGTMSPVATKAVIVEKLGMLASFLDWVGPTSPNADICYRVKKVVRRVLEQALEAPVQTNMLDEGGHWNMDVSADFSTFFNFDLLDTFEWLRPEGA
ncbi:hypothetical protein TGAM01_v204510 [Trichoderma gamsii]|uniref:Zn(2)-C6 fungal-type domain-containing protein n=1 Tax=Trichoderma gamsii TaxID=398673 RepID=A0A2P4ZQC5_9HYPO|nr:hypothetical protein TGAM01_v204510 [Trichoderma gamsii]PON26500.1 hypothetical protein TGAM01_v204510 [Trichoderma gamsii]